MKKIKQYSNHIIICNWNDKAATVIEQLLNCKPKNPYKVVVITQKALNDRIKTDIEQKCLELAKKNKLNSIEGQVEFHTGDPRSKNIWKKFNVPAAKSIVLLACNNSPLPDNRNTEIALIIQKIYKKQTKDQQKSDLSEKIHIVAEIINPALCKHLKNAGVSEIISESNYRVGLISQSAISSGIASVYDKLLQYSDETNEIYFIQDYPASYNEANYINLKKLVRKDSPPNNPLILLGILKNYDAKSNLVPSADQIKLNPTRDIKLEATDALVVMTYDFIDKIVSSEIANECSTTPIKIGE
jgi:voltage-gated potassium channel